MEDLRFESRSLQHPNPFSFYVNGASSQDPQALESHSIFNQSDPGCICIPPLLGASISLSAKWGACENWMRQVDEDAWLFAGVRSASLSFIATLFHCSQNHTHPEGGFIWSPLNPTHVPFPWDPRPFLFVSALPLGFPETPQDSPTKG